MGVCTSLRYSFDVFLLFWERLIMRIVGNNVTERAPGKHTLIDGLWVYRGLLWSEIEVL